jgi:hypothetical protein
MGTFRVLAWIRSTRDRRRIAVSDAFRYTFMDLRVWCNAGAWLDSIEQRTV